MNTQTSLLACALAGLLPVLLPASVYAAPLPAASPPASAAADTPAVGQFTANHSQSAVCGGQCVAVRK